jgi:prevent-host-death family protein
VLEEGRDGTARHSGEHALGTQISAWVDPTRDHVRRRRLATLLGPPSGMSGTCGGRRGARSATIVAMTTESLRAVRDHLSEVIDRVEHQHERVVITRNGRAAAVLISPEDLEALEETLSVLHDPEALADIREADAAYARGDVVRGVEAVRRLRQ